MYFHLPNVIVTPNIYEDGLFFLKLLYYFVLDVALE